MESVSVNWEALDSLVMAFAKSDCLIEDPVFCSSCSSQSTPSSSAYRSRVLIRHIRKSLEVGDIIAGIDLLRTHAPAILEDRRIVFQLQKQKFIEILRRGTTSDRDSAVACLRDDVAPCALDAYPEAYEEFKHIILMLIYGKDDQNSPVVNEWSEKKRFNIAGLVSSILRAHFNAFDPVFSMTLRYLISIHKGFCLHQGIQSPISDLSERLLLDERDSPAIPQEHLFEVPPFDENDIQALAHSVKLTRQEAVDSLKFTRGDIDQAFQNELCRMNLDGSFLDELIYEYCVFRSIVECDVGCSAGISAIGSLNQSDSCCSSRNCSVEMDCETSKPSDCEASTSSILINASPDQCTEDELHYSCERAGSGEDCSTSITQPERPHSRRANKRHLAEERGRNKRWRGRHEKLDSLCSSVEEGDMNKNFAPETLNDSVNNKYETLRRVTDLTCRGFSVEVVDEVNSIDSDFFLQNPILLFRLKQVEFLNLVSSGDHSSAIKVACSYLGPLAANNPTLLKHLKESLLALLRPSEDALQAAPPLCAVATSLQVAIGQRLGIEEPRLMKIMKAILGTHTEWFKLQMCKDRFETLLMIDSLKDPSIHLYPGSVPVSEIDPGDHISPSSREPGSSPGQVSSTEVASDESAILKVMEFLAMPRSDAIQLLAQSDGNAEAVIQQMFI